MKTGRIGLKLFLFHKAINLYKTLNICKTLDIYKAFNIHKAFNIYKALDIHKILLPLNGRSRTYRVSKAREDKVDSPVLDAKKIIILLSINAKG